MTRSTLRSIASLAVAGVFSGCSGAQNTGGAVVIPAAASSSSFGLGFVAADSRTIAQLTQIRRVLSDPRLPTAVDLSSKMPPVGNQGQTGSCVSWASAYAMRGYEARQDVWSAIDPKATDASLNFSPAFVYNQVNGGRDAGSTIPSVLNVLKQKGAATLADMPYAPGQFLTQPSAAAFADAANYKLSAYGYITPTDLTSMKSQLAAGLPVIVAIKVYNNFFAQGANQVYATTAGGLAGGHAITEVGYDDSKQAVKVMNSWGTTWGTGGFGWISYAVLNQIAVEAYSAIDDHGMPVVRSTPPVVSAPLPPAPKPTAVATAAPKATALPTVPPKPMATATAAPKPQRPTPPKPAPTTTPKAH